MELLRNELIARIDVLGKIKPEPFTALGARGPYPLLGRVQRKESERYIKEVSKQKKKAKEDLDKIDKYLEVKRNNERMVKPEITLGVLPSKVKVRKLGRY